MWSFSPNDVYSIPYIERQTPRDERTRTNKMEKGGKSDTYTRVDECDRAKVKPGNKVII